MSIDTRDRENQMPIVIGVEWTARVFFIDDTFLTDNTLGKNARDCF